MNKVKYGSIREDFNREIYHQRSIVENEKGEILAKIFVCASLVFLSDKFQRPMKNFVVDGKVKEWFKKEANRAEAARPENSKVCYVLCPNIPGMQDFVDTLN